MYATYVIWSKHMNKFLHSTEEALGLALQSVLWVVLFGVGMRGLVGDVGGSDYMSYMLPGIIALSALGGAVGGGLILLDERLRGITKEYLVSPIPRLSILLGNASSTATKAMLQALLMLLIGILMGARLVGNPFGWLAALLLIALFTVGFSGIALAIAAQSRSIMGYHGMIFLFNLPVLFASNALYPLEVLPTWMRVVVLFNPATYLIDAVRALAFGTLPTLPLLLSVVVVLAMALLGVGLAYSSFQQSLRRGS
ncbi:MAG: ABC transporter permease [Chloroflexaceae bacterium]|nr:ABC transporter permease [Chloroflexaceae bacterium]NJL33061.1 ABC transporter permease [Chloroflexaceae bacterium]NJO04930.1 ABC transporter permease [Chloroflexaceae bacterium]